MAEERGSTEAEKILDALHTLSVETEDEILAMSREQVQMRLKEEGINIDAKKTEMRQRMDHIRRQRTLQEARERRIAAEEVFTQRPTITGYERMSTDQMRTEASRRINQMSSSGTFVQTYFNRFNDASDDDLPGLLDDLRLLEDKNQEGDGNG